MNEKDSYTPEEVVKIANKFTNLGITYYRFLDQDTPEDKKNLALKVMECLDDFRTHVPFNVLNKYSGGLDYMENKAREC